MKRVPLILLLVVLACAFGSSREAAAINASPIPVRLKQPDGTEVTLRIHGDALFNWFEDMEGRTVVLDQGRYVYAGLDADGWLIPTGILAGRDDEAARQIRRGIFPSREKVAAYRQQVLTQRVAAAASQAPALNAGPPPSMVPPVGTVKNLVVLCKFSDHDSSKIRAPEDYEKVFNSPGGDPVLAPTGSVRDYFLEASYGTLTVDSTVVAWVTLPNTEAYYANGQHGMEVGAYPANGQGMVEHALNLVDPLVNFGEFDRDNDGYIDAITFIHSGYAAETGGGGGNWIWSHKWSLWALPGGRWTSADNNSGGVKVKVYDYHTEAALWGTSGNGITRIGVICHETGHFFGLPDLYDTDDSSSGIGSWCLMANSWGFDNTQRHPPHLSAWCKQQLGWVTPTVISPGTYSAPRSAVSPTVYRIDSGYPSGEYLLIENRQPYGFESTMPQGGLCIWHIDETKANNTQEGYPGQSGWPGNGSHYKVALLQADGLYELEKKTNRGNAGDVYRAGGVSQITPFTVPNTHRYQGGNVQGTNNHIVGIGAAGATMSFTYSQQIPAGSPEITVEQPAGNPLTNGLSSVSFGEVQAGSSPGTRTFTLRNAGDATLTLSSVGIQGAGAAHFQAGTPSASNLAPGQTATLNVGFAPQTAGTKTAELRIGSNDADDNPYLIALKGVGLPSANADLSALAFSGGALSPAFSSSTTNYTAGLLPNAAAAVTVVATKAQASASIHVRVNGGTYAAVASGSTSGALGLNVGGNTIEVRVTAEAGNTRTYSIAVTRDKAAQSIAFPPITDKLATDTVTLSATGGSSGNPVTFSATGPAFLSGNVLTFTGPGSVTVRANQAGNAGYHAAPEVARTFAVAAVPVSISLGNMSHVYDGQPKTATASTLPAGVGVQIVGGGPWTNVGNYGVTAIVTDPRYVGSAGGVFTIAKAPQNILFANPGNQTATATLGLSATGGGSGRPVTFSASGPATITGGNQLSFTGPGQVTVRANQPGNTNYLAAPEVAHTFTVHTATAPLTLSSLHQVADGSAREVTVTTDPPDLPVELTYDGSPEAPTAVGTYAVVATVTDARYEGGAEGLLVVDDPTRSVTVPGGALPDFSAFGERSVPTFRIGAYEVTGSQWAAVVAWAEAHAGYDFDGAGSAASGDRPVAEIAWSDAAKWCNARTEWENAISGRSLSPAYRVGGAVFRSGTPASPGDVACDFGAGGYRLPTAAEWEFAARGGAGGAPSLYPGGGDLEELGWHSGNSGGGAQPAGGKAPNSLGLHDLAGNVAEWTWDAPIDNPAARLLRGGSWQGAASDCELSALASADSALPSAGIGLRLVRSVSLALAEVLDHPGLSWESGGPEPWGAQTGTTHDGEDAAESSPLAQGETAWMETVVEGPGNLSFRWKTDGAEGEDILSFAVGGAEAFARSGIGGWEEQIVEIDEGSHLLRWTYARGSATGESRAWIDSVAYAEATVPSVTTAPASGIGGTSVTLGGEVVHDGGREITGRGVVYGPSPDPTLDSGTVLSVDTQGEGSFAVLATGLSGNTVLYARAYAINLLGTAYGESVVFTTASIADFADGPAAFDREILPGDQQRFQFSLAGPRFVSFSTVGGASLRAELRNSQGEVIAGFDGDADFALVQLLHAGAYLLEVYRQPGEGERQDYRLTLDAGTVAATRPDVAVGSSPSKLMGRNVHLPARQLASLVSKKAKPVTAYAAVGNAGNLPDVLLARAGKGNGFFKVTYHAPTGNATASLLAGSYRTARVANGVGSVSIRIAVKPNKKKLTRSKGGRPSTLRKTLTLPVSASSTFQPSTGDAASVQVKTK